VELIEDAHVRPGSVRVDARFVDIEPAPRTQFEAGVDGTRRLRLEDVAGPQPPRPVAPEGGLWLGDQLGLHYALEPRRGVVRVGRATDNDLCLTDQQVSRYHAQLRWVESSWLLYDLDSTNGTFVDQLRVYPGLPQVVRPGVVLRLGDHVLEVHQTAAS
jgi:hypothetical protein